MGLLRIFWFLITPTSRWDYVWKVLFLTCAVLSAAATIETGLGYDVRARSPVYVSMAVFIIIPFTACGMYLISQMRQMQEQLAHLAQTDMLTGLNNRRAFLQQASDRVTGCVVLLDIDHFKLVNDTYGHDFGDKVLEAVAAFLKTHSRKDDILARFGGEEFVLYLPEADHQTAGMITERLVAGVRLNSGLGDLQITLSAGIAGMSSPPGLEFALKCADDALYAAKNAGRACFKVSSVQMAEA